MVLHKKMVASVQDFFPPAHLKLQFIFVSIQKKERSRLSKIHLKRIMCTVFLMGLVFHVAEAIVERRMHTLPR